MLGLFTTLAMALHNGFASLHLSYLYALIALVSVYVSATSFNDLADEAIDKINHKGKQGRLLVTKEASRRDLAIVGIAASIMMFVFGLLISPAAFLLMLASLAINIAYSLPPLRLSYRTFLVPFVLATGYVVVPYLLGIVVAKGTFTSTDTLFLASLYALFLARINLKDFRDRAGDSKFGKPTFLLRFGKPATIFASQVFLWLGTALAVTSFLRSQPAILVSLVYASLISWLLIRLRSIDEGPAEQVVIGVAAKVGNGLLLSFLAILLLGSEHAPSWVYTLVLVMLLAGSAANLKFLSQDPRQILESYRG
jgi:4-hydroxybenzoate polyprenyltransferase